MKVQPRNLLPTLYETIGLILLALFVIFLGNFSQLLNYYGLQSSGQVIRTSASQAIENGLSKIDNFSFTDRVVTFIIWAFIGMLCFSVVQGIGRVGRDLEYEERLSSNKFIHPKTFRRGKFWLQVAKNYIMLVISLAILSALLFLMLLYVLPASLAYCRSFLSGTTLSSVTDFLIGWAIMAVALIALDLSLRLVINHHRVLQ